MCEKLTVECTYYLTAVKCKRPQCADRWWTTRPGRAAPGDYVGLLMARATGSEGGGAGGAEALDYLGENLLIEGMLFDSFMAEDTSEVGVCV